MTYCLALRLHEGMRFLSDTRTNAASTTWAPTARSTLSTAAANLSVGPPYDIGFSFNETRTLSQFHVDSDPPLLEKLQNVWERHLLAGIAKLPAITQDDLTEVDDPTP